MCGRYNLFAGAEDVMSRFRIRGDLDTQWQERYNIAPGQLIPAVRMDEGERRMSALKWGLIPSWAKDPKIGYKMINARAETADEKPSFKPLLKQRRCLIPANGFYEWKKEGGKKQPYHIHLGGQRLFAFAGLWTEWEREGESICSCTIITTEANELMKDIHDRMPVILAEEGENVWLDGDFTDLSQLKKWLVPYDSTQMEARPVSSMVNSVRNEGKELLNSL